MATRIKGSGVDLGSLTPDAPLITGSVVKRCVGALAEKKGRAQIGVSAVTR